MIRTSTLRATVDAEPLDLAVLEDAEELRLQGGVELADLVEEERPAVGELEPARLRLVRAGEGALLVAEELALDEGGGEGGAVDRDERPGVPLAVRVEGAGEQLLAGAGLPEEQDGRGGVGDLADLLHNRLQGRAPPDDLAEVPSLDELRVQVDVLGLQAFAEALVLRQGRPEGELDVPAGKGAGDDLADQPEPRDEVRRPALLAGDRGEHEQADDAILHHHWRDRPGDNTILGESRAVTCGRGRQLVEPGESHELPTFDHPGDQPREGVLRVRHRRPFRSRPHPSMGTRHHPLVRKILDDTRAVGPEQSADGAERLLDLGVDGVDRRAEQARSEPADALVELDRALERPVGSLACECASEEVGDLPELVDHRRQPGSSLTDRAEHEPAYRRVTEEQGQARDRLNPEPLEEGPVGRRLGRQLVEPPQTDRRSLAETGPKPWQSSLWVKRLERRAPRSDPAVGETKGGVVWSRLGQGDVIDIEELARQADRRAEMRVDGVSRALGQRCRESIEESIERGCFGRRPGILGGQGSSLGVATRRCPSHAAARHHPWWPFRGSSGCGSLSMALGNAHFHRELPWNASCPKRKGSPGAQRRRIRGPWSWMPSPRRKDLARWPSA